MGARLDQDRVLERVWRKSQTDRLNDIDKWRLELLGPSINSVRATVDEINQGLQERKELLRDKDRQVLEGARIIGATTTGAASNSSLLSSIGAGVIIVEEAGEVLESHVLTALSEQTKHLILIGDHKQLRPKIETYKLMSVSEHGYDLDCSLFERLVTSKLPSVALEVQHRMRPEISRIIRAQTYPRLRDHDNVKRYPDVKGVCKNLVFIDHRHLEVGDEDGTSKKNPHEAEICVELVRFFLLQGYKPDQIVVLTPYLGQLLVLLQLVKAKLKEVMAVVGDRDLLELKDQEPSDDKMSVDLSNENGAATIRCSSVDNFQGEEADIVIVSIVRSNDRGSIGFLKEEQRVNVLLSRARIGMFLFGNSECLRQSKAGSAVWNPILDMLAADGQLLHGLPTTCQLHPDDESIELQTPDDFRTYRPNGGCSRPCEARMSCGHACPKTCHPIDRDHLEAQKMCVEPCRRFPPECQRDHPCPKICRENCGSCGVSIGSINLLCGHSRLSQCYEVGSEEALIALASLCAEPVDHTFIKCNHRVSTTCSNARNLEPKCPAFCGEACACGHLCRKMCVPSSRLILQGCLSQGCSHRILCLLSFDLSDVQNVMTVTITVRSSASDICFVAIHAGGRVIFPTHALPASALAE
jgi:hypothetical protein